MTGQNDLHTQILSGEIVVFAGHCPVFQLILFGKGSCNFSGGSHRVGLPG